MESQAKINEKCLPVVATLIAFQALKVKIQNTATSFFISCFLVVLHKLLHQISTYHFLQLFRTSFNSQKKIFVKNFPFLTNLLNHPPSPHSLNNQNQLSVTSFLLMLSINV